MYKKGLIVGISGLFAGAIAGSCVDWDALPRAALVMGVAVVVSMIVLILTRKL